MKLPFRTMLAGGAYGPVAAARGSQGGRCVRVQMQGKGVDLEFVDNPALNTGTPQGRFMLTILAAVAELERATIRERQAEGIALAKPRGVYERAPALTIEQITSARERIGVGVPKALVVRDLGVSRQTLFAALKGAGAYRG